KRDNELMTPPPAMTLGQIEDAHILNAVRAFAARSEMDVRSAVNGFELLLDGHKRYPLLAIVAIAVRGVLSRSLSLAETEQIEESPAVRLVLERGFEVVTTQRKVGLLDA